MRPSALDVERLPHQKRSFLSYEELGWNKKARGDIRQNDVVKTLTMIGSYKEGIGALRQGLRLALAARRFRIRKLPLSVGRHTTYNLIGSIIPVAIALVTVPLYLELVGPARYGVLSIAWLLLGYFGLFDLGLGSATAFRIAALRDEAAQARADTFWAALCVNLAMGVCGGVVLWGAGHLFFGYVFL